MTQPNGNAGSALATGTPTAGNGTHADLAALLSTNSSTILEQWVATQLDSGGYRDGQAFAADIRASASNVLGALEASLAGGHHGERHGSEYGALVALLSEMSADRAGQGYSPSQTAVGVFSLKDALGAVITTTYAESPEVALELALAANRLVDDLGLVTFEAYVARREEIIGSQQQALLDLSTPVVKLWDGIVAVPLIGTLDSARTQMVMEALLEAIVETESRVAIIDITGVAVVDTLVAQHLLKTVAATRLMGADCIISGIRPNIAQTMVHLGVEMSEVTTKATLAEALRAALAHIGRPGAAGLAD